MTLLKILLLGLYIGLYSLSAQNFEPSKRPRIIVLADMENEPDETQQLVHLLLYANRLDLEGLIACTSNARSSDTMDLRTQRLYPERIHKLIDGYAKVRASLSLHEDHWPAPSQLHRIVSEGQDRYGMAGTGEGQSSRGSGLLKRAILKTDPRPLCIVINGGANTLAQTLFELKNSRSPVEMATLIEKLRVFENGARDDAGAWITHQFPNIHWIRSNEQTYAYAGPGPNQVGGSGQLGPHAWQPFAYSPQGQYQWLQEHIVANHGQLGTLYPLPPLHRGDITFVEGGGTIPWLGLVHPGLTHVDFPHWGGWSGRYTRRKQLNVWSKYADVRKHEAQYSPFYVFGDTIDAWIHPGSGKLYQDAYTPVFRWREAMYNDFRCRMDWCKQPFSQANHQPIAAWKSDASDDIIYLTAKAGKALKLNASKSKDPDQDSIQAHWWIYPEAGTYPDTLPIEDPYAFQTILNIPREARNQEIHLILEVKDLHPIASLYDYRRIVIQVQ